MSIVNKVYTFDECTPPSITDGKWKFIPKEKLWKSFKNNRLHNSFGPALFNKKGTTYFYEDGLLHNFKGPAIIAANGNKQYYLEGRKYELSEFIEFRKPFLKDEIKKQIKSLI